MQKHIYPYSFYNEVFTRINGIYKMIFRFNNGIINGYMNRKYLFKNDRIRREKLSNYEIYEYVGEVSYPEYYYSKNFHIYCEYEDTDRFDFYFSTRRVIHKAETNTVLEVGNKLLSPNHRFEMLHVYYYNKISDDSNIRGWLKRTYYRNFKLWTLDYDINFKINKFFHDYFPVTPRTYFIDNIYSYVGTIRQNVQLLLIRNRMFETLKRNLKNMKTYMKDLSKNKNNKIIMYKKIVLNDSDDSDSD